MIHYTTPTYIEAFTTEREDAMPDGIVLPVQTHSCNIAVVRGSQTDYSDTDALVTNQTDVMIGIRTADCVPVLLYDDVRRVVAAVHAGWRGTVGGITRKAVEVMVSEFGCRPADVHAIIGPSISPEVFEVGDEVVTQFVQAGFPDEIILRTYPTHIDLWKANQWLLTEVGVPVGQIETAGICTYSNTHRFFSARREGIATGRIVSGIKMNKCLI